MDITLWRYLAILVVPFAAASINCVPFVQQVRQYDLDMARDNYGQLAWIRFNKLFPEPQTIANLQLVHELKSVIIYKIIKSFNNEKKLLKK